MVTRDWNYEMQTLSQFLALHMHTDIIACMQYFRPTAAFIIWMQILQSDLYECSQLLDKKYSQLSCTTRT